MRDIRRREGFRRLLIIADAPDYHSRGREAAIADALSAAGISVLYLTRNAERDAVKVAEEVKPHLHLMNRELIGFLPHLVAPDEMVQLVSGLGSVESLDPRPSAFVVDLTEGREAEVGPFSLKLRGSRALFLVDPDAYVPVATDHAPSKVSEADLASTVREWIERG